MTRDRLPDGDRRNFAVVVEDDRGAVVYSITPDLVGTWKVAPPA